mmetsp:Transcript_86159/g.136006  ORF Transcript_86159/g.136006 Transcript_86159/m.136006 type:complete len:168 (-) Transcript_86159:175-678(-)|eukprot:CAMPEP_0169108202 /NCGR_PEP_ID=MMETSP1015-20121227/25298_1 /TAXON_ID=342587 /ORGANISM="Karlodinium micrum, Strain CCMP2283" /LENGTH=167 /DNA_ID=CAMNT_0009169801 /DNA_START=49 /DNA_END=552 /DNA_ORIENTATION=+
MYRMAFFMFPSLATLLLLCCFDASLGARDDEKADRDDGQEDHVSVSVDTKKFVLHHEDASASSSALQTKTEGAGEGHAIKSNRTSAMSDEQRETVGKAIAYLGDIEKASSALTQKAIIDLNAWKKWKDDSPESHKEEARVKDQLVEALQFIHHHMNGIADLPEKILK